MDTLARWMAHYIAEQITVAEKATGEDKVKAEELCFETILKLWQHRSFYPKGKQPFESFEPIFRALERLDPENKHPYFFNTFEDKESSEKTNKVSESVQQWLDVASGIDQVARIWLDYVFRQAALCATDEKTLEWLKASIDLQDNHDASIVFRLLNAPTGNEESNDAERLKEKKRELLNSRIEKLEAFSGLNQKLLSIFKKELEDL